MLLISSASLILILFALLEKAGSSILYVWAGSKAVLQLQTSEPLNLVPNPGFEEPAPAKWDTEPGDSWWSPLYFWASGIAREEEHSAGIINVLPTSRGRWVSKKITAVTAGTMYTMTGWIQTFWAEGRAYLTLSFLDNSDQTLKQISLDPVKGDSDWTKLVAKIAAPEGTESALVKCVLEGRGIAWFDDLALYADEGMLCPALEIQMRDRPDPVEANKSLLYTIEYANMGNIDVTGTIIVDIYDPHVSFDGASLDPVSGTDNQWQIGFLAADESGTLEITVTVGSSLSGGKIITNVATISADTVPQCPNPFDEKLETTRISTTGIISLSLTPQAVTGTVRTLPGMVTYSLLARNEGAVGETVDFSVQCASAEVIATVVPTSAFLLPGDFQVVEVDVSLPVNLSGDQVQTVVYAEARTQDEFASAVQVTCYDPFRVYLPVMLKSYPISWQPIGGLQDKTIYALATTQGQSPRIYAGPDSPQLLTSTTCGASWSETDPRVEHIMALLVADFRIYLGTWGRNLYTCETNAPLACDPPLENEGLKYVVSFADDGDSHIYAGTNPGDIFRSTVGSNKWERVTHGIKPVWALTVDSEGHLYAGTYGGGIYKSNDGFSWKEYNSGLPEGDARTVWALAMGANGQICTGTNGGVYCLNNEQWEPSGLQGKSVRALANDLTRTRWYAGTKSHGIFFRDEGGNWLPLADNGLQDHKVYTFLVEEPCDVILAGTDQGVWKLSLDW